MTIQHRQPPPQHAAELLWEPDKSSIQNSMLAKFVQFLEGRTAQDFSGANEAAYFALQGWAVANPENFWDAVWDFCGVVGDKYGEVIRMIDRVPGARFFPDSKISYAENLLRHAKGREIEPAIIARTQGGPDQEISWQGLHEQVSIWQQALENSGIKENDVVGVYLPNIPETIILLLAASNIGAVFVSAGMEMGGGDLITRFSQAKPKILITTSSYAHGAKQIDRSDVIARAQAEIASITKTVMLEGGDVLPDTIPAAEFLKAIKPQKLTFKRRDFNHPLYILFSSGSTGKPKCFEHSSGGVLLKHLAEYQLNSDVRPGDRVFYHATPSWMMWNWLASGLASGATILMYDGSPAYPDAYAQWDFTALHRCTHHGTAAPVILSWQKEGISPREKYDLSPLRMVLSTGAVLPVQGFEFIHTHVKKNVKISPISGGTDIVGCFVGGNPFMPTYAGQINGPMLGMDVCVWDDDGNVCAPGQAGELVCANVFPSMPLRFLDDPGEKRYKSEYFEHYKDRSVWRHGDTIERTAQGQFVIIGRSDATLNQNGVRIGAVAIYDQLAPFGNRIKEAAAVDFTRPDNKQAITILFLELPGGVQNVPDDLAAAIKKAVKDNITPYAIPTEIMAVPGILKTPNGKKAEVVMKKILAGKSIPNASLYGEELVRHYEEIGRALTAKYGGS